MKKIITITALFISSLTIQAQLTAKDVFTKTEIVWYGLDFTKAHFVGQFDQGFGIMPAKGWDMRNKWIPEWNALIGREPQNFDLRKAFRKDIVHFDLGPVNELTKKMDGDLCMSFNPASISPAEISQMVTQYTNSERKEGLGVVFIVENFNKAEQMADVYVTFFDIATKKVLFIEKAQGKPFGNGMRNYWAGAVKNILKQIDGDYKSWKNKYGK